LFDILPLLKQGDSYRVQRGIAASLAHLGGFLLLTAYSAVHFTGEPGMSCPWGGIIGRLPRPRYPSPHWSTGLVALFGQSIAITRNTTSVMPTCS